MTLTRYTIRNEFRLGDPELYRMVDKDDSETLLESIAMAGLVGLLRQLGDLAEFAAEIFHDLHEEVGETLARSHSLVARVQHLEAEFPPIEKALLSQTDHSSAFSNPGVAWHPDFPLEQNLIAHGDAPRFVKSSYEECRDPPRLFLLDKFDVAGAGACLKRYTDPSFFRAKKSSMGIEIAEAHQEKIRHKVEKTKSQWTWKNGEIEKAASTCTSNTTLHQLFLEDHADNDDSSPARSIKLKRWQRKGSQGGLKSAKSYMEKLLDTPADAQHVPATGTEKLTAQHAADEEQAIAGPVRGSFKQEDDDGEDLSSEVDDYSDAVALLESEMETENTGVGFIAVLKQERYTDQPGSSDLLPNGDASPSSDGGSSCRRSSSSHDSSFSMGEAVSPALPASSPELSFLASAETCSSSSSLAAPHSPLVVAASGVGAPPACNTPHELVEGEQQHDDGDTSSCSSSLSSLRSIVADSSAATTGCSSAAAATRFDLMWVSSVLSPGPPPPPPLDDTDEDPSTAIAGLLSATIKVDDGDEDEVPAENLALRIIDPALVVIPVVGSTDSSPDGFVSEVEKHVTSIKRYRFCNAEQDDGDDGGLDSSASAPLQPMRHGEISEAGLGDAGAATHLENQLSNAAESNGEEDDGGGEVAEHRCKRCEANGLEGENPNRKKVTYPRNPLVDDVAAHGRSKLKRVVAQMKAHAGPSLAARDSMLEQIRAKSFNLRPTSAMLPCVRGVQGPKTNWKVAAILEKANAIRQALAGSDEDDNSEGWSDS